MLDECALNTSYDEEWEKMHLITMFVNAYYISNQSCKGTETFNFYLFHPYMS